MRLSDLGYSRAVIATKATPAAASSPFPILSDEGVAVMLDIGRQLRVHVSRGGDRIPPSTDGTTTRRPWTS